jgi:hypothetical protein
MRNKFAAFAAVLALSCPAWATLTTTTNSASYTGNGSTTAFTVPFKFLASSDLVVTVGGATKALGSDYSVKGAGAATGTVTFTAAPGNGLAVVITRSVPLTQPQSFRTGSYLGATHEQAFDRIEMQVQQNAATHAADKATQATKDASQDIAISAAINPTPVTVNSNSLILATGTTTARTEAARAADTIRVQDFLPTNYVTDGSVDYVSQINSAIAAASGKTLRLPAGTFRHSTGLTFANVNVEGEGPDKTILLFAGAGQAVNFNAGVGHWFTGIALQSNAAGQSGFLLSSGTGASVRRMRVLDFDGVGFQVGVVDVTGAYFSDIDYIECANTARTGTSGFIVDGGGVSISSNANVSKNVFVKGKWATLYDIRGNNNIFIGGDAEMNNSAATITQVFRISGGGNKFRDTYVEQAGATFPALFINFTSTAISNSFNGVYLTASSVKNLDATITDAGTGNEFRSGPIGGGFPAQGRNTSPYNLLANSGFGSMRTSTLPLSYTDIFGTGTISRDSVTVRGSAYSMRMDVVAARAGIAAYVATNSPGTRFPIDPVSVAKLRGRTVTASVWVNSNAANVGALKVFDGTSNIGSAVHTGSGNWELLTVTAKVLTTANEVGIQLRTDSDGTAKTGTVYFSEPQLVIGNEVPYASIRPLNDYAASMAGPFTFAPPVALTYGATIATDASLGNSFTVTATNGAAFTMSNPTNLKTGQRILYTISNTSGGALGVITWAGTFKLAAFTAPATGFNRSIEFQYNGTNLIQLYQSAADVPN